MPLGDLGRRRCQPCYLGACFLPAEKERSAAALALPNSAKPTGRRQRGWKLRETLPSTAHFHRLSVEHSYTSGAVPRTAGSGSRRGSDAARVGRAEPDAVAAAMGGAKRPRAGAAPPCLYGARKARRTNGRGRKKAIRNGVRVLAISLCARLRLAPFACPPPRVPIPPNSRALSSDRFFFYYFVGSAQRERRHDKFVKGWGNLARPTHTAPAASVAR